MTRVLWNALSVALSCPSLPADRLGQEILGAGRLWAECWDAAQRLNAQAVCFPRRWHNIRYIRDKMRRDVNLYIFITYLLHVYYTFVQFVVMCRCSVMVAPVVKTKQLRGCAESHFRHWQVATVGKSACTTCSSMQRCLNSRSQLVLGYLGWWVQNRLAHTLQFLSLLISVLIFLCSLRYESDEKISAAWKRRVCCFILMPPAYSLRCMTLQEAIQNKLSRLWRLD